jgi:uncharacterized protein YkwD
MNAAVACLVNQQRARFHLPELNDSSKLDESAQRWADYLASTGQLVHGNVTGRMTAVGYDWGEGGENIADQYVTPRDVVAAWMASSEHCQNILDPDYRDVGTGESPQGSNPAAWVQDFGLLMDQSPLSSNYGPANGCPYTISASPNPSGSGNPGGSTTAGGWPTSPSG